jgi:arylsulfatase A-like enzyme
VLKGSNVILISIDTLRADHLSLQGYGRETTPSIDDLARRGVVFTTAVGQATRTSPNVASLLTAQSPLGHGVVDIRSILPQGIPTIAEVFKSKGYATGAVVANSAIGRSFGYLRGFDWYVDTLPDDRAETVVRLAEQYVARSGPAPFFLWIHMMDPHSPYTPPVDLERGFLDDGRFTEQSQVQVPEQDSEGIDVVLEALLPGKRELREYVAAYDGEVRYADQQLGEFLRTLEEQGLETRTLIALTADHGEDLGEGGRFFTHGKNTFEPTARVPLVFAHPLLPQGRRIRAVARTIDIFPTLVDLVALGSDLSFEGRSLAPLMLSELGAVDEEPALTVAGTRRFPTLAIRGATTKVVLTARLFRGFHWIANRQLMAWPGRCPGYFVHHPFVATVYDLATDPHEQAPRLVASHPEGPALLRELMVAACHAETEAPETLDETELEPDQVEKLKALGYF